MSGFEEFNAAILDERNVAPGKLKFELGAVARCSEQDRLRAKRNSSLPSIEDLLRYVPGLGSLVGNRREVRLSL